VLAVEPGGVEHQLGGLVVAEFGVAADAVAVRRLERRVDRLDPLERLDRVGEPPAGHLCDADVRERRAVLRVDRQGPPVRGHGLFVAAEFFQGLPAAHEPVGLHRVDFQRGLELFERLGEARFCHEVLRAAGAVVGVDPGALAHKNVRRQDRRDGGHNSYATKPVRGKEKFLRTLPATAGLTDGGLQACDGRRRARELSRVATCA
jgi:hypothetical protein